MLGLEYGLFDETRYLSRLQTLISGTGVFVFPAIPFFTGRYKHRKGPKRTEKDRKEPKRTEKDRKRTEKDRKERTNLLFTEKEAKNSRWSKKRLQGSRQGSFWVKKQLRRCHCVLFGQLRCPFLSLFGYFRQGEPVEQGD